MKKANDNQESAPPSGFPSPYARLATQLLRACLSILVLGAAVLARPPMAHYDAIPGRPLTASRQSESATLSPSDQQDPGYRWAAHSQGNIQLTLNNHGDIGELNPFSGGPMRDPITGEYIYGCTYPRGSKLIYYLGSSIIVGGIVGRDTLVSCWEFNPEVGSLGEFKF